MTDPEPSIAANLFSNAKQAMTGAAPANGSAQHDDTTSSADAPSSQPLGHQQAAPKKRKKDLKPIITSSDSLDPDAAAGASQPG